MRLDLEIKNSNLADNLPHIVQNAQVKLSFWGYRYLEVVGYEKTASIDALAARIITIASEKNYTYPENERKIGQGLASKISAIYELSDDQVRTSNCFTRFMAKLIDFINSLPLRPNAYQFCSKTRRWWKESICEPTYNRVFDYYTVDQYREKYGAAPSHSSHVFDFLNGQREPLLAKGRE